MKQNDMNVTNIAKPFRQERRKEPRSRLLMSGKLLYNSGHSSGIDCLVIEMSQIGACVETEWVTQVPERFYFKFGCHEVRQVRRVWAAGNAIGLEFV